MTGFQYCFAALLTAHTSAFNSNTYSLYKRVTWDTAVQTETISAPLKIDWGHLICINLLSQSFLNKGCKFNFNPLNSLYNIHAGKIILKKNSRC